MIALAFAAALAAEGPDDLSPAGEALVAAVSASIEQARARQAALPPPKDDTERILRLGELDQAPRAVLMAYDMSKVPQAERARAMVRVSALVEAQDREDQAALLKLVPPEGWFLRSRYGRRAAWAAFDIVQHGDLELQERFLPALSRLVPSGEIAGESYAMMYDRVQIEHNRPQLYGTQFRCDAGKWRAYPTLKPNALDARRTAIGFDESFATAKARMEASPPCPQTMRPPPPEMKLD